MPRTGQALGAGRRRLPWAAALVGVLQVMLVSRSIGAPAELWPAFAFGWACALLLAQEGPVRAASPLWIAAGLSLIAVSLLELWPQQYRSLHRLAALCGGSGVVLLAGPRQLRRQLTALAMLLFPVLVPAPRLLRHLLELSPATAAAAALGLRLSGVSMAREGVLLKMPHSTMLVADACSGLSQVFALLMLAAFAIWSFPTTRAQKMVLVATAVVIGFTCNAVRIAALAAFADRGEMERFSAWHDGALSPLCMVAATAVALAIWLPMLLRRGARPAATPGAPSSATRS